MTLKELEKFDGRNGNRAYVAVSGVVYDVTDSALWPAGEHAGEHQAGQDLTEALKSAPHVRTVIERFPVVAQLKTVVTAPPRTKKLPLLPIIVVAATAALLVIMLLL